MGGGRAGESEAGGLHLRTPGAAKPRFSPFSPRAPPPRQCRAAMAVLRQQKKYVEQLYESGIIDEPELEAMSHPVQARALVCVGCGWGGRGWVCGWGEGLCVGRACRGPGSLRPLGSAPPTTSLLPPTPAHPRPLYQARIRSLETAGPSWRAPRASEVLRGLPFMLDLPDSIFQAMIRRGQLQGEPRAGAAAVAGQHGTPTPPPCSTHPRTPPPTRTP